MWYIISMTQPKHPSISRTETILSLQQTDSHAIVIVCFLLSTPRAEDLRIMNRLPQERT